MFALYRVTEEVVIEGEKNLGAEKPSGEEDATEGDKENPAKEPEEKEPEVNLWIYHIRCILSPSSHILYCFVDK